VHPTGAVGESGVKLACARGPGDSPCLRSSRHDGVWTVNQGLDGVLTNRPAAPDHKGSLDRQIADGVGVRVAVPGRRTAGQWRRLTHVTALVTAPRSESRWRVRARRSAFTVGRRRQRARSVIPRPDGRGMRNDRSRRHAARVSPPVGRPEDGLSSWRLWTHAITSVRAALSGGEPTAWCACVALRTQVSACQRARSVIPRPDGARRERHAAHVSLLVVTGRRALSA
jgi:hypothetical protein